MSEEVQAYYNSEQATFWTKKGDDLTVVGDYLARLPAIELIDPKPGEKILDAGCGAGWMARRIALERDARVYGCDFSKQMIAAAEEAEAKNRYGIEYTEADITKKLPYEDEFFDGIICTGVAIHLTPNECVAFAHEAARVLKPGGRIVIALFHPELFRIQNEVVLLSCEETWVCYVCCNPGYEWRGRESCRFNETYYNNQGQSFTSVVWYHPLGQFARMLSNCGLTLVSDHNQYLTLDVLVACGQQGQTGYPAYHHIVAAKH